ncbi:uncharacterized protein LOC114359688 [Ostrinia furnacalis]|uniref:uncharacterized protein LOC114359688 n=1 Tax=Ostrinia furnacalis TaxID=93504 RepID=UPI00103E0EB7|nr:uncharacterized protein LOC114359688 [Ostrinia furnacalis]
MTVVPEVSRVRGLCHQLLMVLLINVPTMSLGMAMGWVSLVSGEREETDGVDPAAGTGGDPAAAAEAEGARVVAAAATTFLASLVGVPLSARALSYGRKFALIATSMCFVVCWSLKLVGGGWWVLAARVAAGLGGAGAYSIAPLVAREMCEKRVRGAAAAALIPAHNVGFLLMYLAADFALPHTTILWSCLSLSLLHCAVFLLVPESPAYLAANNKDKEAVASLAWLRGVDVDHPSLAEELAALPPPDNGVSTFALLKDMISDRSRRRAFIISFVAIVGQEACGVYTLMQFAERTFVLARDEATTSALEIMPDNATYALNSTNTWNMSDMLTTTMVPNATSALEHGLNAMNATVVLRTNALLTPARQAVVLGAVQLVASAIALYLVERVGRRRLLITSAFATGGCLAAGAGAAWAGRGGWAGAALAGAVAADNAGLQPAPYAMLADMFHYQFRSAVMMLSSAGTCVANAAEVMVFPALAARAGLPAALLLAALLTLSYAIFALFAVPETRGKTPEHIYSLLDKKRKEKDVEGTDEKGRRSEPESDSTRVLYIVDVDHPSLAEELAALPPPDNGVSTFALLKDMISDRSRRRAFIISFVAIVGQEACGVYTLMQFAERTFVLARDEATTSALEIMPDNATYALNSTNTWNMSDMLTTTMVPNATSALEYSLNAMNATVVLRTNALLTPARQAVVLGAVQLVASAIALYLVERVGRRRLLITSAFATGGCLAAGAGAAWAGRRGWAGPFRSAVMMLSSAGTCVANAAEVMVFPALAARAGLPAALLLAALLTLSYAIFALFAVPETRGKTPEHIYSLLDKKRKDKDVEGTDEKKEKDVEGTDEKERRSEPESDSTRQLPAMGLLDKLSGWLGRGPTEVTVLVLGLDNSGKSTLLNALRPPEQRATALAPTVASTQDHFSMFQQLPAMGLLDKLSGWLGRGPTEVTVLVLGLDNSGKSTLLNALRPPEQRAPALAPTVASTQDHFSSGGVAFSAWDVSGAPRHRALWERHYRRAHAVIFVVDAADHLRLVVAREELELMLAHPDMCGRRAPLLVFANKSDAPHALAPMQTATALGLERITDKPWHICASSAISGAGLADGVAWLARQLRDMHMHH